MTPSFKQVFLCVLLAVLTGSTSVFGQSKDNLGKEFYVAFAANQGANSDFFNNDTTTFALYITGPVSAKGYVEVPAIGFHQDFVTIPGQITTIALPDGDGSTPGQTVEISTSGSVLSGMSVHVVADTEVAVYGMSHKRYSTDAFMAMPIDVLGTEYRAISYPTSTLQNFVTSNTPGQFWIIAVNDSTNVSITPKARTANGRLANQKFEILLNRGDVYLVQGDRDEPANDLTGTLIEAELPIALFTGHERTEIPRGARNRNPSNGQFESTSRDHLIEQVPPVSAWGDSALVIPFFSSDNPDLVRVVSAEDGNKVTINGTTTVSLDAGRFYEITALNGPTSISAIKPIMVGQYMHTSEYGLDNQGELDPDNPAYGDPALAMVYPVEQFAKSYTFISVVNARAFQGNFVNIVVEQSGVASMLLDGQPIAASQFKAIPGSTFVYAQITLKQGTHNITGATPFGITVYGMGGVDSYAYTGGTLLKTITPFKTADIVIDFGDRPLEEGTLAGEWDTTVFLQNISSDPLTIDSFMVRTGDVKKFWVENSTQVRNMGPGQTDSMTIHFRPLEADRRMHTVIQAKTEHLRAYVVDVYGRGVLARPNTFSTPTSTIPIDTIDFGIIGENSPPRDTLAYILNRGSADMLVDTMRISGPDAADFSIQGISINSTISNLPFTVPKSSAQAVQLDLRFSPKLPRAGRLAFLDYSSPTKQKRRVVLIARVDSIELATVTPAVFDSILICESDDGTITINNPNTFAIKLLGLNFSGPNTSEFSVVTQLPLTIGPGQTVKVQIRFSPTSPGIKSATITATFDIPVGGKRIFTIQGVGRQLDAAFWSPREIAILGNEEVLFPIYAKTDLARYQTKGYVVEINYDPTYLEDVELIYDNTINPFTYYLVEGYDPGYRKYICTTADGSMLTGGGIAEERPLVNIKFKGLLPIEAVPVSYAETDINYKVHLTDSPLPTHCIASDPPPGRIIIDSSCAPAHIVKQVGIPTEVFIDYPSPNPVSNGSVNLYLYLPEKALARLEIIDILGNHVSTLLSEEKEAGKYKLTYNTSHLPQGQYFLRYEAVGKVRTRRLGIVR